MENLQFDAKISFAWSFPVEVSKEDSKLYLRNLETDEKNPVDDFWYN